MTGGGQAISAEISLGDVADGSPGEVTTLGVREIPNLIGQYYDPRTLSLSAQPSTVDEGSSRQLAATATMDDATTVALVPDQVAWSESSAALEGIGAELKTNPALLPKRYTGFVTKDNRYYAPIRDAGLATGKLQPT